MSSAPITTDQIGGPIDPARIDALLMELMKTVDTDRVTVVPPHAEMPEDAATPAFARYWRVGVTYADRSSDATPDRLTGTLEVLVVQNDAEQASASPFALAFAERAVLEALRDAAEGSLGSVHGHALTVHGPVTCDQSPASEGSRVIDSVLVRAPFSVDVGIGTKIQLDAPA